MGTSKSFCGDKVAEVWSWPLRPVWCRNKNKWRYTSFLQCTFVIWKGIIVTLVAANLFVYCHTGHSFWQNIILLETICTGSMVRNFSTCSSLAFVLQQVTITETDCIHSVVGRDLGTGLEQIASNSSVTDTRTSLETTVKPFRVPWITVCAEWTWYDSCHYAVWNVPVCNTHTITSAFIGITQWTWFKTVFISSESAKIIN